MPDAVSKLLQIYLDGDLSALGGKDWEGFRLCPKYHTLTIPFFHRPFEAGQIKAMFFTTQGAWADRADVKTLQIELNALRAEHEALKVRAAFYQRQVHLESKMGMMLARIVG